MLYLKILFQVGTGVAGLLALLLDYKWHDKKENKFKNLRNVLIIISVALFVAGIIILVNDEKNKNKEISLLQNNLSDIKKTGDKLNDRITPILELAASRYPNLSAEAALDSLRQDIYMLDKKTSGLENSEYIRKTEDLEFQKLKKTPPSIDATLKLDNKKNIYLAVQFLNKVPIKFMYSLVHSKNDIILSNANTGIAELFPPIDNKITIMKDDFNFPEHCVFR